MAWTGLALTVEGRNALNRAQMSNKINFKSIVVGDGNPPANFSTLKALVHQLYELDDLKIDVTEDGCILTADFPKVGYDYYFREIGVMVDTDDGEKLYVYDNCGDDAQYIVSTTGAESTKKRIRLSLKISDVEEITVTTPSILYVAYDDFERVTDTLAENLHDETVRAKEAEETIKTELNTAKLDKDGDASNVTTTFTQAESRENIESGEKLSIILGKIKKFFADLKTVAFTGSYNDLSNRPTIPAAVRVKGAAESTYRTGDVNLTPANIGLGNVDNTSDLNKPVSTAQQEALDAYYQQSFGYTDQKIAGLINGAPSTLDTLGEIAQAMQDNESVVDALDEAIGKKASEAEFDSHVKDTGNPHQVTKTQVGLGNVPNVATNDQTPTFTQASTRANIESGEKLSVILGKIKKFFADLKTVAFSGSYNDLSNKPTSMKNPSALTIQLNGTSQGAYDGSSAKTVNVTPGGIGALPVTGGTVKGDLRLQADDDENYGRKINFGDSDYVYLHEYDDDCLEIRASALKFSSDSSILVDQPIMGNITGNAATATKWATARTINGMSVDGTANRANYGTCGEAGATVQKTVACTGFELIVGAEITVRFLSDNAASSPTLNVNGTGAKPIYYHGHAIPAEFLTSWRTYTFRYNGSQYDFVGDAIGGTDISAIGDGTVTGAILQHDTNIKYLSFPFDNLTWVRLYGFASKDQSDPRGNGGVNVIFIPVAIQGYGISKIERILIDGVRWIYNGDEATGYQIKDTHQKSYGIFISILRTNSEALDIGGYLCSCDLSFYHLE